MRLGFTSFSLRQKTTQTMQACRISGSQIGQVSDISQEGDDLCFWDAKRVLFVDYLVNGQNITGAYYANLIWRHAWCNGYHHRKWN